MDSGVAPEDLETDLEGDADSDVLDSFIQEIRGLEERVTQLEQEKNELREKHERLKSDVEALLGGNPPVLVRKKWDKKVSNAELDEVEEVANRNVDAIVDLQEKLLEKEVEKSVWKWIQDDWKPGPQSEEDAVELFEALLGGDCDILNERYRRLTTSQARNLLTDNGRCHRQRARRAMETAEDLSNTGVIERKLTDKTRAPPGGGPKRSMLLLETLDMNTETEGPSP